MALATLDVCLGESKGELCPHSCWGWWGTGLLGDSSEDEWQVTEKSLQLHSLSQTQCPLLWHCPHCTEVCGWREWTSESLTSVSPSTQELNDMNVQGGADPDTGVSKATLLLEAESKYIQYIGNHARVRKELWQEEKRAIIFLAQHSAEETDSQLRGGWTDTSH